MSFDFQKWTGPVAGGRKRNPPMATVSINSSCLAFNAAATAEFKLAAGQYVVLYSDKKAGAICIERVEHKQPFQIAQSKNGQLRLNCKAFIQFNGLALGDKLALQLIDGNIIGTRLEAPK